MKTASICTFAAALGLATMAMGQVNVIVTYNGQVAGTDAATLNRFTITLDNTGAGNLTGIDIALNSSNALHQVQSFNDPDGSPSPFENASALNTTARLNADTHLLFTDAELIAATTDATEGAIAAAAANDGSVRVQGFVSSLVSNDQGILGASQANQLDILQVVLAPGQSATLTGFAAVAGETEPRVLSATLIPEPASLGLIAIGGLALARRRLA